MPEPVTDRPIAINHAATVERVQLDDTSWVDVARGWLDGADELFDSLLRGVTWEANRLFRYERFVEERRLGSMWKRGTPLPHPALAEVHRTLQHRYRCEFGGFGLIQYRDGRDGQAFHRDTDMRWLDETVIAILTVGAQRPWQLRPWSNKNDQSPGKGATHDLAPSSGDLIVMGGRCQADWQHSVPYLLRDAAIGIRISMQWRWSSGRGKPYVGTSYRAPLRFDQR